MGQSLFDIQRRLEAAACRSSISETAITSSDSHDLLGRAASGGPPDDGDSRKPPDDWDDVRALEFGWERCRRRHRPWSDARMVWSEATVGVERHAQTPTAWLQQ